MSLEDSYENIKNALIKEFVDTHMTCEKFEKCVDALVALHSAIREN